jgi:hypothetical protein
VAREKAPRVVAELGRPETPEETAARKAENSRRHRASQTTRNLVASLIATVAVVAALVAIVVRPDPDIDRNVDWHAIAAAAGTPVVDPQLPDGWTANAAELRGAGDTRYWYIGFLTPEGDFAAVEERAVPDDDLVDDVLPKVASGPVDGSAGGLTWSVWDATEAEDPGNYETVWESRGTTEQLLVYGTADPAEVEVLADAVGREAQ